MKPILEPKTEKYIYSLLPRRDPVRREMESYAARHDVPIIGPACGRLLYQLARLIRARRVFEMGSAIGYSTLWLAQAVGPKGKVFYTDGDPVKPIGDWKKAWEAAKLRAKVACRFHDLRHTACAGMLESGAPFSVVATLLGWSPSTAVRMARRYGHIGRAAQREAVKALDGAFFGAGWAQNWAQSETA